MKEQILTILKSTITTIKAFAAEHPKLSLFLFGAVVGLLIAFVF
jgi:hypothetical protein